MRGFARHGQRIGIALRGMARKQKGINSPRGARPANVSFHPDGMARKIQSMISHEGHANE
jgi:hypothetical protein